MLYVSSNNAVIGPQRLEINIGSGFFIGGITKWDSALMARNWAAPEGGLGFWVIFAIFFPAVTGFTGVNTTW